MVLMCKGALAVPFVWEADLFWVPAGEGEVFERWADGVLLLGVLQTTWGAIVTETSYRATQL